MGTGRRILGQVLRLIALPLLLVVSLVLHIPSPVGRSAVRDIARAALKDLAPGHVTIRRITRLNLSGITVEGLNWSDLDNKVLLEEGTLSVTSTPALIAAAVGGAPWPAIALDARRVNGFVPRLSQPQPVIGPPEPPSPLPSMRFPNLRVHVRSLHNTVGYPIDARNVRIAGGLRLSPTGMSFNLRGLSLETQTTPLSPVGLQAHARVRTYPALSVDGGLSLSGAPLRCNLTVVPQSSGEMLLSVRDCFVPGTTLQRLAALDPAQTLPDVSVPNLAARGRPGTSWVVDGRVGVGRASFTLSAYVGTNDQSATLRFDHVVLRDALTALPEGQINGAIALSAQNLGDHMRLSVDGREFQANVAGNEVPPFLAVVEYRDGFPLRVERFDVPMLLLHTEGTVGLAVPNQLDLRATFEPPPIQSLPWTRTLGSGRVRGDAHITGTPARLNIDAHIIGDAIAVGPARVNHADVRGNVVLAGATPILDVTADLQGVAVRGSVGPSDATVHATGNPNGVLRLDASAHGPGLLAALGPAPAGRPNNASVRLSAVVDRSDPDVLAARVTDLRVNLRGASAQLRGAVSLRPARPAATLRGNVTVDAGAAGTLAATLAPGTVTIDARRFDLAWAAPIAPQGQHLAGRIDGNVRVDLNNIARSRGQLALRGLSIPDVGTVTADLTLARREEDLVAHLAASLVLPEGAPAGTVAVDVVTPPVRDTSDPMAWLRVVRELSARVEIADLERLPLSALGVPRSLRMQGRFAATVSTARPTPGGPLAATVGVEARSLVVGVGVPSLLGRDVRMIPAVHPLWVRGALCASLTSLSVADLAPRLRFAVGRDFNETSSGPPTACDDQPLMPRTLLATDGSLRGPWLAAINAVTVALQHRGAPVPAATRALLTAAAVDWRVSVGPFLRSEWPLRTVAIPQANGPPTFIRPPDVPLGTMVHVEARARGNFLVPGVEVEVEASAPTLSLVGLEEPVRAEVFASLAPREGGTILDSWAVHLAVQGQSSPNAPRELQARVAADLRLSTSLANLRARGAAGVAWDRFDVDSENLQLERFTWARDRGLEGRVAVRLLATDNPREPVNASVTVEGFRARLPESLQGGGYVAPAARARVHAVVRTENGGLMVRTCAIATTAAATPDCSPDAPVPTDGSTTESILVVGAMPVVGTFPQVRPDLERAVVDMVAAGYPLETLSRFIPDDTATNLGGTLQARVHWDGQHPSAPSGEITIRNGRATITALGEPMRELDLHVVASDSTVRIERMNFALGRGTVRVDGEASITPEGVTLTVHGLTRTAPAVLSGYTWAWLDGSVQVRMDFRGDGMRGNIDVERLSALVQDQPSSDLQPTSQDPNIFIVGRTQLARGADAGTYAIELTIHSQTPVWVRRSDFAIALRTDLRIRRDRAGLALAGTISQGSNQSWYSLFGKQFDLDRVRVTFDGSLAMNPELDVAAHHSSPSAGRINVTVSGRLDRPTIVLTSESFPTASQAEILAMIVLGRRSPAASSSGTDFAGQFAQAIVSLVSSIVASGITREFSFLPTIIAEPTTTGAGARYGAGVNLSSRLYVQATYSAGGGSGSSASGSGSSLAQEFRLLAEYAISEAITFAASFSSRGAGSADVFWSP